MSVLSYEGTSTAGTIGVYQVDKITISGRPYEESYEEASIPRTSERLPTIQEFLKASLHRLGIAPLLIEIKYADGLGLYAMVWLPHNAHHALESWMEILNRIQHIEFPIFVRWTGDTDVSPEILGTYIGKALAKMDVFLATEKKFDIVEILHNEWLRL